MGAGEPAAGLDPAFPLLREAAAAVGATAYTVGGYVRDRLLGRDHPDLDIVVEAGLGLALAGEFARRARTRPPVVFERFGTAQVTWQGRLVEFVSTRAESYRADSRKPDVRPATLRDDLRRRDFTVNALLMDFEGHVSDPLGTGLPDLERRLLRTPLDPAVTFSDDPLRMLRAVRFAAQLGFELAPDLLPAMARLRERLRPPVVSIERVSEELRKLLLSPRPARGLDLLSAATLLELVLPELEACKGVAQGNWHTHDVYGHTLLTVEATPPDLVTRLAALFHDVGKPATAAGEHFHGHEVVGAQLASAALERLRFSHAETERVARLVRLHLRPVYYRRDWSDGAVRRLAAAAGDDVGRLLDLAQADLRASAYPDRGELAELRRRVDEVLAEKPSRFQLPIDGRDIMATLGLPAGPEVGRIKDRLLEQVMDGELEPDREALLEYLRREGRAGA